MNTTADLENTILLGIDGGASKISGWTVELNRQTGLFRLGKMNVKKNYSDYPEYIKNFKPVEIGTQLAEMNSGISISGREKIQADVYKKAAADVIIELLQNNKAKKVLIGIGMPGLKTKDLRGISGIANGPRMPDYCNFIEEKIEQQGIELLVPIAHLGSDADYCGLGEEFSENGLFRNSENAYYIGGGTGVADALKLKGKLVRFDNARQWIAKAWEMKSDKNISLEQYVSASGIQKRYSFYSKISVTELNKNHIYPLQILEKALNNDEAAIIALKETAKYLAELLFERIATVYSGWSGNFSFLNPDRETLSGEHPYQGILLEQIVIGQRLGELLLQSLETKILWLDILKRLGKMIMASGERKLITFYLRNDTFREEKIQISRLREAPALGAGIDAYFSYNK